ncbi:MAG: hypothetical protein KJN71_00880, partial [Acidimicrobiia bacterium]|nr:hypothetical protein [Acidimicrobiia bacterium]
ASFVDGRQETGTPQFESLSFAKYQDLTSLNFGYNHVRGVPRAYELVQVVLGETTYERLRIRVEDALIESQQLAGTGDDPAPSIETISLVFKRFRVTLRDVDQTGSPTGAVAWSWNQVTNTPWS